MPCVRGQACDRDILVGREDASGMGRVREGAIVASAFKWIQRKTPSDMEFRKMRAGLGA